MDIYLLFSRAVGSNDVDLFNYMLGKMTDVFFDGGKPNYSRYITLLFQTAKQ